MKKIDLAWEIGKLVLFKYSNKYVRNKGDKRC